MSPVEALFKFEMQPVCKWKYKNKPTDSYELCKASNMLCEIDNCVPFQFSKIMANYLIKIKW